MAIPPVKLFSNEPGGPLLTVMNALNAAENQRHQTRYNKAKADYAPTSMQAEAASKLAYANLMGPQFLAKLLQNPGAIANMGDPAAREALQKAVNAGMGQGTGQNYLNQMPQHTGIGQPSTNNFAGYLKNAFKGLIGQGQGQSNNPFAQSAQPMPQQPQMPQQMPPGMPPQMPQQGGQAPMQAPPPAQAPLPQGKRPRDGVMLEGEQWYNAKGEPVYAEEEQGPNVPMELEITKGIPPKSYAEKEGEFKGTVKQREKEGEYRAAALKQIGESQLGLSNSGAVLDRMTGIVKNPVFANMRNTIPGFQNKQLDYLKVMGTPEQKELIGDFLSTGESFIASTVQGFSGKPLVREFDLAQRQKITPHDTIDSAIGKLHSATALHDIAEKKNQIVSELLQKGYNEADAVRKANKMVDVSAIEKETNSRLQRKIEVRNSKTGEKKMVTLEEARKMGIPNV